MKNFHDIVVRPRLVKNVLLSLRLNFWIKGIIACTRHDSNIIKEVNDWPEGFSVLFKVFKDKPCLGIKKIQGSLHIIKTPISFSDGILFSFKSIDVSYAVLSGKIGFRQALIEKRFDIIGNSDLALSAVRVILLAERILLGGGFLL